MPRHVHSCSDCESKKPKITVGSLLTWLNAWYAESDGYGPTSSTLIYDDLTLGEALRQVEFENTSQVDDGVAMMKAIRRRS